MRIGRPCPDCREKYLVKPEGWQPGDPFVCENPLCPTNLAEE